MVRQLCCYLRPEYYTLTFSERRVSSDGHLLIKAFNKKNFIVTLFDVSTMRLLTSLFQHHYEENVS